MEREAKRLRTAGEGAAYKPGMSSSIVPPPAPLDAHAGQLGVEGEDRDEEPCPLLQLPDDVLAEVLAACMLRTWPRQALQHAGSPDPARAERETDLRSLAAMRPALAAVCRRFRSALERAAASVWRRIVVREATDADLFLLARVPPPGVVRGLALLGARVGQEAMRRLLEAAGPLLESLEVEFAAAADSGGDRCRISRADRDGLLRMHAALRCIGPTLAAARTVAVSCPPAAAAALMDHGGGSGGSSSLPFALPGDTPLPPLTSLCLAGVPLAPPTIRALLAALPGLTELSACVAVSRAVGPAQALAAACSAPGLRRLALALVSAASGAPATGALREADLAPLAGLPSLSHLALAPALRSLRFAAALPALTALDVRLAPAADLAALASAPLRHLALRGEARVPSVGRSLHLLTRLETLELQCSDSLSLTACELAGLSRLRAACLHSAPYRFVQRLPAACPALQTLRFVGSDHPFFGYSGELRDTLALARLRSLEFDAAAARCVGRRTREYLRRALPAVRIAGLEAPPAPDERGGGRLGRRPGGHVV